MCNSKKLKYLLEFNDFSQYEDEYGELDSYQVSSPKKRAKSHRISSFKKRSNAVDPRVSDYTYQDLIKRFQTLNDVWRIRWNHRDEHDLLDRIVNRTNFDVPHMNHIIGKIITYMEKKWEYLESGDYIFTLTKSNFKIVLNLKMKQKKLFIGTVLSDKMNNFDNVKADIMLNESFNPTNITLNEL